MMCCGCTSCANACPKNAISMLSDTEGFLYPSVDKIKCVDCGICERVCPVLHREYHKEKTEGYIIRYKDEEIVKESTSGGAFTAFADYLMTKGYTVYGAGYDSDMHVVCKMASKPEELKEFRGSKFVQSHLGTTFQRIKRQLSRNEKVLFTGTPCQVAGLINYLGGKPENLICMDFVCRGVPSPGLWKNYVIMMENKYGSKMTSARFKHKTYGYHATTMKVEFANGKVWYGSGRVDPMMKAFVKELASRPSCHACAFKSVERQSDITMFDCYEFSSVTHLKDDNKGYSSLLIHTDKGKNIFNMIMDIVDVYPVAIDKLISKNGVMIENSAKPNPKREQFYKFASQYPIDIAMNMVDPITKIDFAIEKTKWILNRFQLIPLLKRIKKERVKTAKKS